MTIGRREFLVASGATLAAAGLSSFYILKHSTKQGISSQGFLFGEGVREHPANPALNQRRSRRISRPGSFTLLDLNGNIAQRWSTPFLPHLVRQNPWRLHQIIGVQKWGEHMALLDLKNQEGLRIFTSADHVDYFGHAEFLDQGRIMAVSAQNWKSNQGEIHLFETDRFELINIIPSFGSNPHDLQVDIKDPDILLVANTGAYVPGAKIPQDFGGPEQTPKMTWIDWRNKKTMREIVTKDPENYIPGHFNQITEDRVLIYGNTTRPKDNPSLVVWKKDERDLRILSSVFGDNFAGECLNSYHDIKNKRMWFAVPDSNKLVVLDSQSYEKVQEFPAGGPRALTPITEDVLYVSTTQDGLETQIAFELSSMQQLSLEDLQRKKGATLSLAKAYGIHTSPYIRPSF